MKKTNSDIDIDSFQFQFLMYVYQAVESVEVHISQLDSHRNCKKRVAIENE